MQTAQTEARKTGQPAIPGLVLVATAALLWSLGGTISRFIGETDNWTIVFWRGLLAGLTIIAFLLLRDGWRQTFRVFLGIGLPGLAVALCYTTATTCFIMALARTSVANILLIQAGVPMIAAALAFIFLGERIDRTTWAAIAVVIFGVAIMVSGSLGSGLSLVGDGLALLIAFAFSTAMVITRRFAHVQLVPATALGVLVGAGIAATQASHFAVTPRDFALLYAFGGLTLGVGLSLFTTGARTVPAALTALVSTLETVLAPLWVWLAHHEVPALRTLIGGAIILAAILAHLAWQMRAQRFSGNR